MAGIKRKAMSSVAQTIHEIHLHDDTSGKSELLVATPALEQLLAYAHEWALADQAETEKRREPTLTFSSTLAAMVSGSDPLCGWLRRHLDLRGVRREVATKSRVITSAALPGSVTTTHSFRQALSEARRIHAQASISPAGLDVRHLMAAYAVVPDYHLQDFLRLRIDRRAWCLDLAETLAEGFPEEAHQWREYTRRAPPVPVPVFQTDAPRGRDLLNIEREVEAFSMLIASRRTLTPLSIAVFGRWGSGKSFFMRRVRQRVAALAAQARTEGRASKYHGQTAQIEFNAWHYSEKNLIASLVDHIFRNLRFDTPDETDDALRQRGHQMLAQIEAAEQAVVARQNELGLAEKRVNEARQHVKAIDQKIEQEIAAKTQELQRTESDLETAKRKLGSGVARMEKEILEAADAARLTSVVELVGDKLRADPVLAKAVSEVGGLIRQAKQLKGRWQAVFWGLVVLTAGLIATAVMSTGFWTRVIAAVGALLPLMGAGQRWLAKLNDIAESGHQFEETRRKAVETAIADATKAHEESLDKLRQVIAKHVTTVTGLQAEIGELRAAPKTAEIELTKLQGERSEAARRHAEAQVEAIEKKRALERVTVGSMLEDFLNDLTSADGYQKELTILSRARNHFERLSKLVSKATEAHYERGESAPPVSRIVLYIDDLDRCPEELVIEVLRVVHLLLAFPLFVCVVAVDPRWLERSLARAPGLVKKAQQPLPELGAPATASDYLEKIFQIPIWVRPVPATQRSAMARELLGSSGNASVESGENRAQIAAPPGKDVSAGGGTEPDETALSSAATLRDEVSQAELDYLDNLQELLDDNPRTLKRFVNTYRLVKSTLSDVELSVFLDSRGEVSYAPYQVCMAQVAVLCGNRQHAIAMVQEGDKQQTGVAEWLDHLAAREEQAPFVMKLRTALGKNVQIPMATFRQWLERTRRYSFYL
jgi:KAP family P-loop domain